MVIWIESALNLHTNLQTISLAHHTLNFFQFGYSEGCCSTYHAVKTRFQCASSCTFIQRVANFDINLQNWDGVAFDHEKKK